MTNVKDTLFSTIKERVDRLRFLADSDPKVFKKILYLIILDDVYDWAQYKNADQELQDKLEQLRYNYILQNHEFIIERDRVIESYVNVNTPQSHDTWKRVWDAPNAVIVEGTFKPFEASGNCELDSSCDVGMIFFPSDSFGGIGESPTGEPDVNLNNLSTCEKMNIFINRNTGKMYYLDESCNWQPIKQQTLVKVKESDLDFKLLKGIQHTIQDDDDLVLSLTTDEVSAEIPVAGDDVLQEVL